MKAGWRIGSIFGISLFIDPSWFFILILVTLLCGAEWQSYDVANGLEWIIGLFMALLLFLSVLMHELGHSLVALSQGIRVHSITLFLFGGIASIEKESKTPSQAFQVAIAGPAVSFGIFLSLTTVNFIFNLEPELTLLLSRLASINLLLTLFNMMPGLPLDGGQVLKAIIWHVTGNHLKGVRWSARSGQLFGWVAICLGLILYLNSFEPVFLWLAIIGWFGIGNAKGYVRMANIQATIMNLRATDVMRREFRVVDANLSVQSFIQQYLQPERSEDSVQQKTSCYFAASQGRYQGYIDINQLTELERNDWEKITLTDIAVALSNIPSVQESASLVDVIYQLDQAHAHELTVLSPANAVAGVIDRRDIVLKVLADLKLVLSSESLETVTQLQDYPPELPLAQLAQPLISVQQQSP
ncbi:MAG: site-2 protease family protein [Cyanobacteria bacterium P01_F01_bin.150]